MGEKDMPWDNRRLIHKYIESNQIEIIASDKGDYYNIIFPVNKNEAFFTFVDKEMPPDDTCWYPEYGVIFIDKTGKKIKYYEQDGLGYPNKPWSSWIDFKKSLTDDEEKAMFKLHDKFNDFDAFQKELKQIAITNNSD